MFKVKKIHRRYPENEWDYKAVESKVNGKRLIYYTLKSHKKKSKGFEVYSGNNYDVDSSEPSYSRAYSTKELPEKYNQTAKILVEKHKVTKWSKKPKVDLN